MPPQGRVECFLNCFGVHWSAIHHAAAHPAQIILASTQVLPRLSSAVAAFKSPPPEAMAALATRPQVCVCVCVCACESFFC